MLKREKRLMGVKSSLVEFNKHSEQFPGYVY